MQPKTRLYRFLEILPGALMWLTFILPVALAFVYPQVVSLVIMVYALLWFFKTMVMSGHLILGYYHYRDAIKINWYHRLVSSHPKEWERVMHIPFIPMYKEDYAILETTFEALIKSDYPLKKIIPILCTEERAGAGAQEVAKQIKRKYAHYFPHFFVTVHPSDLPGEVKGKGPNMNWAAKEVIPQLLQFGYKAKNLLVTTLDADNRVDRHYFACVTKSFIESLDPAHTSYQPLPMYFNNIWDVPLFVRMIALGSSFWVMVQSTRTDRLRNFSAHSQSLEGLIEADYWSSASIVEDGHQYWRSLYAFNGNHTVVPIFVPIYQDAVLGSTLKETIKEQYLQKRRWAWGVSDIAFVFTNNLKDKNMSFWSKWKQFFILLEGHYSWATTSIVLACGGWPPLLINAEYQNTVFAYNFPFFYSKILLAAALGMVITLVVSTLILPPPPRRYKNHKWTVIRDWLLTPFILPFTNIFLGALPAIDSQTRLMFGRYLEFRVTVKRTIDTVAAPEKKDSNHLPLKETVRKEIHEKV